MSIQFINRLKSIMKDRKIPQTELAKRTGIRQSSISDWLNDRYEPKQDKVYIIAKALNVSLHGYLVMMRIFQQMSKLPIII